MHTILVKNVPERLLKELKKLKVELGCKTWAELLELLVKFSPKETVSLSKSDIENIRKGINEFLELGKAVSKKWVGPPQVLEEFRKSRRHENN
jgi:hypothetical protein